MNMPLFDRESTLALIEYNKDLPTLPERFMEIQEVIHSPSAGAADMAAVIRKDQSTTTMIMKVANSTRFNPIGRPISRLSDAIARLGTREAAHIASTMSLMYGLLLPTGMANIRAFWSHAFAVALATEALATAWDPAEQKCDHEEAFLVGLLHDIGRAVLGMRVDQTYFEKSQGHLHGDALIRMEMENYGVDHAEAGLHMLRHWKFSELMYQSVGEHHQSGSLLPLAQLCRLADGLAHDRLPFAIPFDHVHETILGELERTDIPQLLQQGNLPV